MFEPLEYSRYLDPYVNIAKMLFQKHGKLLKWNSEPESIMDLGIGDGKITKEVILPIIPKHIKEYIGADISEPMLQSTKETVKHDKLKIFQIDIMTKNPPLEMKNRFHHIIANYFFHHVSDLRQALANIHYMLKPGGQLFFNNGSKIWNEDGYEFLDQGRWSKYNNRQSQTHFYNSENVLEDYKTLIESLGYVDCHIFMERFTLRVPKESVEEMSVAGNIRLPYVKEEDKEEYIKDYLEGVRKSEMVKICNDGDGSEMKFEVTLDLITGVISKPS